MLKTLVNIDPFAELRSIDEVLDRMFGQPHKVSAGTMTGPSAGLLPVDVLEADGNLVVRAAVPGVKPEDVEISIEKNVLTIRGESKNEFVEKDVKVYRREYSYGAFGRSVRLPEGLDLEKVSAEFDNGFVTITLPRLESETPKTIKVPIKTNSAKTPKELKSNN